MPSGSKTIEISRNEIEAIDGDFRDLSDDDAIALLHKKLRSRRWRLDNLYHITNEAGEVLKFKMNYAQKLLFLGFWYCNIILKSRQHGITTFICILYLDTCLFNSNMSAAIIAHNKEDAKDFFGKKVKFAYDNLYPWLRNSIKSNQDATGVLSFDNGSSLRVTTSGRSGTYQMAHVSEFGKMCAQFPHKAQEVITGTLNTVHPGQLITIESTAEGKEGRFYDMCSAAMRQAKEGRPLGMLDYKFHFFGAQEREGNRIDTPVPITHRMREYFNQVEAKLPHPLDDPFKYWYVSKESTQGEFMKREHPLTPEEAFEASTEGAYYAKQMTDLRKRGQIGKYPYRDGILVFTFWDIGIDDYTAIWFAQKVGGEIHLIHYYENSGEGLLHYADYCRDLKLQDKPVRYGNWFAPHDMMVREYTSGKTRKEIAAGMGINFEIGDQVGIATQIQMVRQTLPICHFDYEECELGISRLDGYRKEWNDKLGVWRDKPRHDENSHGASAFALLASEIPAGAMNFHTAPPSDPAAMQNNDRELAHQDGWT